MSHTVIIALGSNTRQSVHIQWASERLAGMLGDCRFSSRLWTADIKGSGMMYINRLVRGTTTLPIEALILQLKSMEQEAGRTTAAVTIDLDVLLYDDRRYHEKDWQRPYVQRIINEIL